MAKASDKGKKKRAQPLLAAAVFCENVLEEKESLTSLVRILDIMTVTIPTDAPILPPQLTGEKPPVPAVLVMAFIAFKSGDAKGNYHLTIDLVLPSGKRDTVAETDLEFMGDERGVNVKAKFPVPVTDEALYWYEVRVDGKLFTRMPLRIRHAQKPQLAAPAAPSKTKTKKKDA